MGLLDTLGPRQKQIFMVAVPAVAAVAIINRKKGDDDTRPTGTIGGIAMPSTDAIGISAITDLSTQLTDAIAGLYDRIDDANNAPPTAIAPPAPAAAPTAPAAAPPPSEPAPTFSWGPLISPTAPIQTSPGYQLPDATGVGQVYVTPDGYSFTYG